MTNKTKTRSNKKVEKTPRKEKIDGMPWYHWLTITLIFVILIIIVSGWAQARFDDVEYWGSIPLDLYTGILFFAVALFVPMTMMLKRAFNPR
jgi:uncharacterized membrane protein YhaH (DUF805 family)